jgi:hypothetical protein
LSGDDETVGTMSDARSIFQYMAGIRGEAVVVELSIEGRFLKSRPRALREEDANRLMDYVLERGSQLQEKGLCATHFPATGRTRYEHYLFDLGDLAVPEWLA